MASLIATYALETSIECEKLKERIYIMSNKFSELDEEKMHGLLEQFRNKATKLLFNVEKTTKTLKRAFDKALHNEGAISEIFHDLKLLLSLVKDYITGAYRGIPFGSIVAALAGILYFLSPIDLIPDFLLGIGLIDDVFVISLVLKQIHSDLQKYEKWKSFTH